MPFAPIPVMCF